MRYSKGKVETIPITFLAYTQTASINILNHRFTVLIGVDFSQSC